MLLIFVLDAFQLLSVKPCVIKEKEKGRWRNHGTGGWRGRREGPRGGGRGHGWKQRGWQQHRHLASLT